MKKFLVAILAILILASLLSSCNNALLKRKDFQITDDSDNTNSRVDEQTGSTEIRTENTKTSEESSDAAATAELIIRDVDFNQYLDDIHFVPGLSQSEFIDLLENYMYKGKKITDIAECTWYDGLYGGGLSGRSENVNFENDYTVTPDEQYSIYTNMLRTEVQLEGLMLPNDISFGYTLEMVLLSFNFDVDLDSDFAEVENATVIMRGDEASFLTLTDYSLSDEESEYGYRLAYEESYPITYQTGIKATVTRSVQLLFDKDDVKLSGFEVAVVQKRAINQ